MDLDDEMTLERMFIDLNQSITLASRYRAAATRETLTLADQEVCYSMGVLKQIQEKLYQLTKDYDKDVPLREPSGSPTTEDDEGPRYL